MVKVLLDACVPQWLRLDLRDHDVETARFANLDQVDDSALLDEIDGRYEVLVTRDRNLTFQQRIAGRSIAVVVLRSPEQTPEAFRALLPELRLATEAATPGTVTLVDRDT